MQAESSPVHVTSRMDVFPVKIFFFKLGSKDKIDLKGKHGNIIFTYKIENVV